MTLIAAATWLLMAGTALVLLRRLWTASGDGRTRLKNAASVDDFPQRALHLVQQSLDASVLADAGQGGLTEVALRSREPQDPYRTAADLLDWLGREASGTTYAEVCGLIKGVYQLGQSLRAPEGKVRHCLEPLLGRLTKANVGGSPVARVECILPGAMLDPGTMAPLNYGARVTQPLGVLVYDAAGKVLGKAKVLCG
jgi:hypothetical protein